MPGQSARPLVTDSWAGEQRRRMHRADSLIDTIYVCLNAHIHGASAHALDDMVCSIVQEIRRYKGQGAPLVETSGVAGFRAETAAPSEERYGTWNR